MDAKQRRFDFNRAAKLRLLDKMVIPREKLLTSDGTPKRGAGTRIGLLLRVIEGAIGDDKEQLCWAAEATIGERMKCSERQVRRVLREAESLGVIRSKRRGKQKTNLVAINWGMIWEWAGAETQPPAVTGQQANKVTGPQGQVTGQQGQVTGQQGQSDRTTQSADPINDPLKKSATSPSTKKAAAGDTCAREQNSQTSCDTASQFDFEPVIVAMRAWEPDEINGADSAVAKAKARGVTPAELLRVLRVAREAICNGCHAWGAGAIRNRVANARPGEDPAKHWSPPGDQYLKAIATQQREQDAQAASRRAAEQASLTASQRSADETASAVLERDHGHDLDSLDEPSLSELIKSSADQVLIDLSRRMDPRKPGSSLRRRLLLLLEREAVST